MSTQPIEKKTVVADGTEILNRAEQIGRFLVPLEAAVCINPRRFCEVAIRLEFCLKWAWVNCMTMERQESYLPTLRAVARKSLDLMRSERPPMEEGREAYWRETHDLECFHVTALTGDRKLLVKLAEASTYALDNKTGESSGQAWAGVWK